VFPRDPRRPSPHLEGRLRSQETWARRLLSCRCRMVTSREGTLRGGARVSDDATTLRRRRHTDSTPRASPRTPVRDALSLPRRAHLAVVVDVALSRGPQSSRTRVGPFAGDERCVHHRSRVFVTRSPVGRRALASSSREAPLRESSASCVLMIERCVRPTSAHPRIQKRAPIVSCGDRVSSAASARCLATPHRARDRETGADGVFTTPCALWWLGSAGDRAFSSRALRGSALHL
jgi:hypothetical protein